MEEKLKTEKKKTRFIPVIIALIIAVAAIVIVCVIVANGTSAKVNRLHKTAEKYLSEMNYEQAIATYLDIIEIDPKNVKAYIELAEIYVEVDRVADAFEILNAGYEVTEAEEIKEAIDNLSEEYPDFVDSVSGGAEEVTGGNETYNNNSNSNGPINDVWDEYYLDDEIAYGEWYKEITALCGQPRPSCLYFNSYDIYEKLFAQAREYIDNGHDTEKKKEIVGMMLNFYFFYYNFFADDYVEFNKIYYELEGNPEQFNVDFESDEFTVLYDDDGYFEYHRSEGCEAYYENKKRVREVFIEADYIDYKSYTYDEFSCLVREEEKYVYYDGSVSYFLFINEYDRENNIIYRRHYTSYDEQYNADVQNGDVWTFFLDEYGREIESREYIFTNKTTYLTYDYDYDSKKWSYEVRSE